MAEPKKADILRFLNSGDDIQRVAKADVAMFICASIAMQYADEIADITKKYNMYMGVAKHSYNKLDKAMREFDSAFRIVVNKENGMDLLDGYDKLSTSVTNFIEENREEFAFMYRHIHKLIEDYVSVNVKQQESKESMDEIKRMK